MRSIRFFAALLAVSVVLATTAGAEPTEVGTTAAANTDTRGTPPRMATRSLFIGTNVFFEERIETSKTGQAQLLFLDESALTIASNSDVVLDKFIYDPKTSKGELALSVGAGLFRFVGGRISKTSGVTIKTPTATIGIRGGIVIIKAEPGTGKTRAIFMFGKEMTVTNISGVTRRVTRPGFSVDVASLNDPPSSPVKVSGVDVANYLTELEGRTGQTAGLTENLTDDQVADSNINLVVGSSDDPNIIVSEETAATDGTDSGNLTLPPIPNLESEITETNQPPSPSRTLNGFSGGVFEFLVNGDPVGTSLFGTTNDDPANIEIIITEAVGGNTSNGIVTASFDVISSAQPPFRQLKVVFDGTGATSSSFSAIATSATFDNSEVAPNFLDLELETVDPLEVNSPDFCQCEFLQWGFWGGDLQLSTIELTTFPPMFITNSVSVGTVTDVSDMLAYWVAGEIPALIDMPILGTATYSGHAIGTVIDEGGVHQEVGGFTQTYDFATQSGPFKVTNFDGVTYNGGVSAISGQENLFKGTAIISSRTLQLKGAFYSGGGDPVASVGGGFNITGTSYGASGIFAGAK